MRIREKSEKKISLFKNYYFLQPFRNYLNIMVLFIIYFFLVNNGFSIEYRVFDYFAVTGNKEAEEYLRSVDKHHTNKIAGWVSIKRYGEAMSDLDFILKRFPNHPKALILISSIAILYGKPGVAIIYFERAIKLYPSYSITHIQYGSYLSSIGNNDRAIKEIKKAIEIEPKNAIAYELLAECYKKTGELKLAKEAENQAIEINKFKNQKYVK